ncbi:DUF1622 domain-containing protein [Micromonospora maris]|uniref:DUF1622 domain-containing protein n=1 Tax=Micromonospora maris TaxID=1003110 RepID=A0A9X0I1P1_9ACTN|nr:DUF1622 domain-containing protein [Micromonospora maris]AEB45807.1 hypothetical protein VAB18032_23545 [Micromonospora maris AB-18-032]KUJ45138.1 hypothetical protein ADL17_18695 [Micromonospora maris]
MDVAGVLDRGHQLVVTAVEFVGVVVIVAGVAWAVRQFLVDGLRHRDTAMFTRIRLTLSRFLVLGLEFQLAADILRTALSPTFGQIGQLAAVAAIRTGLNYVLRKEIEQGQQQVDRRREAAR